jgi:hypothetical protein
VSDAQFANLLDTIRNEVRFWRIVVASYREFRRLRHMRWDEFSGYVNARIHYLDTDAPDLSERPA